MLAWEIYEGMIWWHLLLFVVYSGMTIFMAVRLFSNSHYYVGNGVNDISISRGMKDTFYHRQKHFTLYDLLRTIFFIPAILIGFVILFSKAGIQNLFPFLKKIFGIKLFAFKENDK